MPRVLITGAAGFIGMHTAIKFLNSGWEVIGLDNMNNYYSVDLKKKRVSEILRVAENTASNFFFYESDLNSNIWNQLSDYEFKAVIHLAAQAGVRYSTENPEAYLYSNILGFQKVIEFVERHSIACFVYASSSSVYGKTLEQPFKETQACNQPESYYAATKKSNELMAYAYNKTKGVKSIGLRFFTVYGPWGRPDMAPFLFVDAAYKNQEIKVFNHGNQKRDFTYVLDIAEGVFKCIENFPKIKGAEVLNIGNGSPIDLMDFIEEIEQSTRQDLKRKFLPAQIGDVESTWADITKLKRLTNYQPNTNIKEGVKQFVKWYEDNYHV